MKPSSFARKLSGGLLAAALVIPFAPTAFAVGEEPTPTDTVAPSPLNEVPWVKVKNVVIEQGQPFKYGDIIVRYGDKEDIVPELQFSGKYDVNKVGVYRIRVTAIDSQGAKVRKSAVLTVMPKKYAENQAPYVEVKNVVIHEGDQFRPSDIVVRYSDHEDIVPELTFAGHYNVNKVGVYKITVTATDSKGLKTTKSAILSVLPKKYATNQAPTMEVTDVVIKQGGKFKPSDIVVRYSDYEDIVPELTFAGKYDVNVPGVYTITATATDSQGATVTKSAKLTVLGKDAPKPVKVKKPVKPRLPKTGV